MDGLVTDANDVFLKLIGYTQDDLNAGRIRWTELTPQDDWERDNFWIAQALSGKPVEAYEKQFIRKDGSFVDVLLGFTLLADSDTKGVAFILDNSKHKAAQRALTFEQAKLRRIVDSSYIGIVFATPYGQILDANDAFLSMIGYSRDDLLNDRIDWRAITPAEFEPQDNAKWKEIIEQGECTPFEKQYLHKEGHPIDVLLGGALLDGPEPVAIAYILDISERRRMEESLKESEQRFRSISDSSPVLIGVTDASTNATYFNKTFLDFSGMSMEELADDGWMRLLHPDDKHDYVEHYLNAFRRRLPLKAEVRFRRFDGEYRWMLAAGAPRLTENGTLLGYFGILTDITEQKETQARLENSEEHLQQMNYKLLNKNNELKDFVYAASHDLQEPLRKIMTFSQRLKTRSNGHLDLDTAQTLERIDNSARRMHELINSLLSYSRLTRESQPFVRLSLNHVVQDVLMDLEIPIREAKAQVEIEELPTISADPVQFRQLFQNLLSNALKFKRPDVSPNIRIYSRLLTGDELAAVCSFCNPQHVFHQIVVEDNGVGFESRYADQIFKIFQRLHSRNDYQGTGIGLAICRKIVERHNGYIIAQSDVGKGSRFMILLPPIPSNIQPDEDIAQPEEAVQTLEAVTG
jgi:PAS domain S-box-containing protein